MSEDYPEMSAPGKLTEAVQSKDRRTQLEGLRDFLVHELEGHRCKSCAMSQLRTGDTAALVGKLQKVLDEIAALPPEVGEKSEMEKIKEEVAKASNVVSITSTLGTKKAPRRQGGRRRES